MDRIRIILCRINLPLMLLETDPGKLLIGSFFVGLAIAIWSVINHVGLIDVEVLFSLSQEGSSTAIQVSRNLPLGYLQQLNYGPWFIFGLPILLTTAAMAWRSWNSACDSDENDIPNDASLEKVSRSIPMLIISTSTMVFLVVTNIQVEVRDFESLGLGWVQAHSIHEAAVEKKAITGDKFKNFTEGGKFRTVQEARVLKIHPQQAGIYKNGSFIAFVCVVKALCGLWQATIVSLSLLFLRVGVRLIRHMKLHRLHERDGSAQWTITPAILMFFLGTLTNGFSIARYVSNMAKGSYGSWDQYASFLVISPGIATSVFGIIALYLVYFEAQGRANPWAGAPHPYRWALGITVAGWITTGLGVIRLLVGLHPATAQQVTEWLQYVTAAK